MSPLYWKLKQIMKVAHSSKDAETLNISKMLDDSVYIARQLEMLYFGDYQKRIPVMLFTDSESTLESIASSKQVDRRNLRMTVQELKDCLLERDVVSYAWLPTEHMWADVLTKEMKMPEGLEMALVGNSIHLPSVCVNEVVCIDGEIRMKNIRNRDVKQREEKAGLDT